MAENQTLTVDELRDFAKGQIAHYKIPKFVAFVDKYPSTVTGKIKKNVMRDDSLKMLKDGELLELSHKKSKSNL